MNTFVNKSWLYFPISISLILLNVYILQSNPNPDFGNIRFTSTKTPNNGTTITWTNTTEGTDKIMWGYSPSLERGEFEGTKHNNYGEGHLFDYTFPKLKPNSKIYYKIYNSDRQKWSEEKSYKTSDTISTTSFSFIAAGDSRTKIRRWKAVANSMQKSDFVLFTGDIVANGNVGKQWERWFKKGTNMNEQMVVYHAYGNHDGTPENFKRQFVLPGNEKYYSFTYGNALFICLDSENPKDEEQHSWLLKTLEENENTDWKVVFFHKPFYTCGGHEGEMDAYFDSWWKAFDDFNVDLIFNGHAHNYQRTKPINRNISTVEPVDEYGKGEGQGRCQIVTGGAGAPLYEVPGGIWYEKVKAENHYCLVDVDSHSLRIRAIQTNGEIIDDFIISR